MDLSIRMKQYEYITRYHLIAKTPVIIRLDGRAFHSLKLHKPFDNCFINCMQNCAEYLYNNVDNCKYIYGQSDELSLLLFDNNSYHTEPWFDNNIQKLSSITAAMCSHIFNISFNDLLSLDISINKFNIFDSRAFNIPIHEVFNYFIWRQRDAINNAIQMLGQFHFTHKQLHKKNCDEIIKMLNKKNIKITDQPNFIRYGWCYYENKVDKNMPKLSTKLREEFNLKYLDTSKV